MFYDTGRTILTGSHHDFDGREKCEKTDHVWPTANRMVRSMLPVA